MGLGFFLSSHKMQKYLSCISQFSDGNGIVPVRKMIY